MYDIVVVGAGASGMAAAISAKRLKPSLKVVLVEALPRVGKKILATGNGRCNLTNLTANAQSYNTSAVSSVIKEQSPKKIIDFFSSIGLECAADSESRVYPMSNTATSVLDCLRFEIERLGIEILTDTKITSVKKINGIFILNSSIRCKRFILSTGGKASPSQGSDGSGYPLLKSLQHTVTPLCPGLVQLTVKENVKALKGVRVKADISLKTTSGKSIASSSGEVLFTDYGLSGIAIMDVSRGVENHGCVCNLHIIPEFSKDGIVDFIMRSKKRNPTLLLEDALSGIVPKKLGQFLIKRTELRSNITLAELKFQQITRLSETIKALSFTVTGTKGFDNAQITVGGADVNEFDMSTLESKINKGLYCTGELLNVDSPCGGFNLQWAWASGIVAGKSAAQSL